jgi:hypothetical protein
MRSMLREKPLKRRTLPRTTCGACKQDYAHDPELCVRVLVGDRFADPIRGETICIECVEELPITGCRAQHWRGMTRFIHTILGTAIPPEGWSYPRPTAEEILRALASDGYYRPRLELPKRLDFEAELLRAAQAESDSQA